MRGKTTGVQRVQPPHAFEQDSTLTWLRRLARNIVPTVQLGYTNYVWFAKGKWFITNGTWLAGFRDEASGQDELCLSADLVPVMVPRKAPDIDAVLPEVLAFGFPIEGALSLAAAFSRGIDRAKSGLTVSMLHGKENGAPARLVLGPAGVGAVEFDPENLRHLGRTFPPELVSESRAYYNRKAHALIVVAGSHFSILPALTSTTA